MRPAGTPQSPHNDLKWEPSINSPERSHPRTPGQAAPKADYLKRQPDMHESYETQCDVVGAEEESDMAPPDFSQVRQVPPQ